MIEKFFTETAKTIRPYTGDNGTYVSVTLMPHYEEVVQRWATALGRPMDAERLGELHATVIWSKKTVNNSSTDPNTHHVAKLDHFEYWDGHDNDGYLVAVLESPMLKHLHKKWVGRGAVHSFEDYSVHITLDDKFESTKELYERMLTLGAKEKGSVISFYKEQIESLKKPVKD